MPRKAATRYAAGEAPTWSLVRDTLADLGAIDVTPADLTGILGADKRTIERWAGGKSLKRLAHFERLRALGEIMRLAKKAHGARAYDWFSTPNPHLGNVRPATLLRDMGGLDLVKGLLHGSLMGGVA